MPKALTSKPFVPSRHQLLWKKDPRFQYLTITKAREAVNQEIRRIVIDIAVDPPTGPFKPHHNGHAISALEIGVGHNDYKLLGCYLIRCQPKVNLECTMNTFYFPRDFEEDFVMLHDKLTPLLFMREELQPVPKCQKTAEALKSRKTIAGSPLYQQAVQKYYHGVETNNQASLPLIAQPRALPTPPQTIQRSRLPHPSPLNHASDVTPPRYLLTDGSHNAGPSDATHPRYRLAEGSRNAPRSGYLLHTSTSVDLDSDAEGHSSTSDKEIIEISDSDKEEERPKIPLLIVIWTMNNSCAIETIVYVDAGNTFCLKTYELALKNRGVSIIPQIENYDPTTDEWSLLGSKEQIGPISEADGNLKTFLLRYKGVKRLPEFPHISRCADLLRRKGKARAT